MKRSIPWIRSSIAALVSAVGLLVAPQAHAELTASERCQIKSFVEAADPTTVPRLRSLIARPDLTTDQCSEALSSALRSFPFDDGTERYLDALLFGPSSQASRSMVAPAVVRGLIARADLVYMQHPGEPTRDDAAAAEELLRIHRFSLSIIRQAREQEAHGTVGLSRDARRAIAAAYQEHIERHRTWLGFDRRTTGAGLVLRAHVAEVLRELAPELFGREQVAGWLGLGPSARGFFTRTGVIVDDGGLGPDVRLREVLAMIEAVPGALEGVSMVLVAKSPLVELRTVPDLLLIRSPLGALAPRRDGIWPADVQPGSPEQALVEAAFASCQRAARARIDRDASFARRVHAALRHASGKGDAGPLAGWLVQASLDPDPDDLTKAVTAADFVAAAATMLLLDAPRTVDLASVRLLAGRPEPFEQLVLGMQLLGTAPGGIEGVLRVRAGRLGPEGIVPLVLSAKTEELRISSFVLDGHEYDVKYDGDDAVAQVTRNGGPFELSDLTTAQVRTTAGDRWQVGDRTFVRLLGHPRLGALGSKRLVIDTSDQADRQWDGVYTEAPSADHRVDAKVRIDGRGTGGVIVRASTGRAGFQGVMLRLSCESNCTAQLVQFHDTGSAELGKPVDLPLAPPVTGYTLRIEIRGDEVSALVADRTLRATLREPLPPGHVGWAVGTGSRVFVRDWDIAASEGPVKH